MLAGKSNFHSQKFRSTKPLQPLMPSSETWSVKLQSSRVRASLWLSSSSQARSSLGPGETETHHSRGFVLTFPFEIRAWSEGCLFKPGTGREEGGQQWLSSQLTGRTPSSLSAWLWRAVLGALIKWLLIKAPKESAILANTNLAVWLTVTAEEFLVWRKSISDWGFSESGHWTKKKNGPLFWNWYL